MGKIIALDTMVFIYLLEGDERYKDEAEKILTEVEAGLVSAVTSIVSVIEVLSAKKLIDQVRLREEISRFFQESEGLVVLPVNWEVGKVASELRRENQSLRTPDSIQLATAIVAGASVFVTNDLKLKNLKIRGLKIRGVKDP